MNYGQALFKGYDYGQVQVVTLENPTPSNHDVEQGYMVQHRELGRNSWFGARSNGDGVIHTSVKTPGSVSIVVKTDCCAKALIISLIVTVNAETDSSAHTQ